MSFFSLSFFHLPLPFVPGSRKVVDLYSTKSGALITVRDPPVLQERFTLTHRPEVRLAVGGTSDRMVWQQPAPRPSNKSKRYKAIMKQVVGAPFTGLLPQDIELEIIKGIIEASRRPFDNDGLPISDQNKLLDSALNPIMEKLKSLLQNRVSTYLDSIVSRLVNPSNNVTWSATKNNCQAFCNTLIDPCLFSPLVSSSSPNPLYLMSFVCPDEGYLQPKINSKFDVPSGLTEEYLLRFHFGRHDDADMIDSQQEYWTDWGGFGKTLYPHQHLFPWDCTEAYGRYPTRCGKCNVAKHVWAFPFDSWSVVSHHFSRDRFLYPPLNGDADGKLVWAKNRVDLLRASAALCMGAVAMAKSAEFRATTSWLHRVTPNTPDPSTQLPPTSPSSQTQDEVSSQPPPPKSPESHPPPAATTAETQTLPSSTLIPTTDTFQKENELSLLRVKLGGIHRAQPFSHYFDSGTYHHYFLASWSLLSFQEQVLAYEALRDGRARMRDVPWRTSPRFTPDKTERRSMGTGVGLGGGIFGEFAGAAEGMGDFGSAGAGSGLGLAGAYFDVDYVACDSGFTGGDVCADSGAAAGSAGDGTGAACATGCGSTCGSGCGSASCGGPACGGGGGGCGGGCGGGGGGCGGGSGGGFGGGCGGGGGGGGFGGGGGY